MVDPAFVAMTNRTGAARRAAPGYYSGYYRRSVGKTVVRRRPRPKLARLNPIIADSRHRGLAPLPSAGCSFRLHQKGRWHFSKLDDCPNRGRVIMAERKRTMEQR